MRELVQDFLSQIIDNLQAAIQEEQRRLRAGEPTTLEQILTHLQRSREAIEAFSEFPDKMDPKVKEFMTEGFRSARQGVVDYAQDVDSLVFRPIRRFWRTWIIGPWARIFRDLGTRFPVPQVKLPKAFVDRTVNGFGFRLLQRVSQPSDLCFSVPFA